MRLQCGRCGKHTPKLATHAAGLLTTARRIGERALAQLVPRFLPWQVHQETERELERVLHCAYAQVSGMLQANRDALERLVELLLERRSLSGDEVRAVVRTHAATPAPDLATKEAVLL